MKRFVCILALLTGFALPGIRAIGEDRPGSTPEGAAPTGWAEIRVRDATTGRGVPLVELETVNGLRFVTDNAGRIAFFEPGLMEREIFFSVRSHGYAGPKDGFGIVGARVVPKPGAPAEIKVRRTSVAERLCRLTGEGRYRHSLLLGYKTPLPAPHNPGHVAGQDSIQATVYRNKVYCFWGDTQRMNYPLGLFRMAGATIDVPDPDEPHSDPTQGLPYEYFVDPATGFARAMMPLPDRPEGVVWVGAIFTVPDEQGVERLVGHYSRRKGLEGEFEQGIAVFNDELAVFEPVRQLPLRETWRRPSGHPIVFEEDGTRWMLFGSPTPNVRVPATLKDVLDPTRYEAFTCASSAHDGDPARPDLVDGKPNWRWQKELPPTDSKTERQWVQDKSLNAEHARFYPADASMPADRVQLHSGSVRWNEHRQRWVLLAGQIGGQPSLLGELWYAEAAAPTGPFTTAVKVLTHDRQSFYNVCHHDFLDRDGGQTIHFEGTYTNDFSGNPVKTPRYNYNQVLYRLDLNDERLRAAQTGEPRAQPSLESIRPSADGTHFVTATTNKRFIVWGVNYDHDDSGRLLEDYWDREWATVVEDFQEIKALGANTVRIHLQLPKFMDTPDQANAANLARLAKLVRLAEDTGLYLDVTGLGCYHKQDVPEWYDKLEEAQRWDVQVRFWQAVAKVCRSSPAIFCYDLMNEPVLAGDKKENGWLAGELGGKYFVQRITLDLAGRTREEVARQWVVKLTSAIRQIDDRTMITVGVIPWAHVFKGAKPLFYAPEAAKSLDFVSVHFYPKKGDVAGALAALKVYDIGKPLVVEEIFPLSCSIDEVEQFIVGSRQHCDGWVSFYWGKTIEENEKAGDLKGTLIAAWLRHFRSRSNDIVDGVER